MTKEHEHGYKKRMLLLLIVLLEQPKRYKKRELMAKLGMRKNAFDNDIQTFRNAGLVVRFDSKFRYYLVEDQPLKQLKNLLHFTEEDQVLLSRAIDKVAETEKHGERLRAKLASLYDYHKLGYSYLRKPHLVKIDKLLEAKEDKMQLILKRYYSTNSNSIRDRRIESFRIDPPKDTLQAFDVEQGSIRHFRISRITRIEKTEDPWQFESKHRVQAVDPFRIMDDEKEMVHLILNVGAYNELVERYPLTKPYILPAEMEGFYDFQCEVNHQFFGLSNFILGSHNFIEVRSPEVLLDHLRGEVKKMQKEWLLPD